MVHSSLSPVAEHLGEVAAGLLKVLSPEITLLSGSATHRFAEEVGRIIPGTRVIPMLYYAHRQGRAAQAAELQRVRREIGRVRE